ncbi:hypothetical protein V496_01693 [Pseudogymnoascus sp. VKM F-4515 (FW-2607)]|nr:hypothetical protein V496_01693 [Pseudogymnoascus sp. VKM F-4515 (FW-2607)]
MGQRRAEMQASVLRAQTHSQQVRSPPQSTTQIQPKPLTESRGTLSCLTISSILNPQDITPVGQIPSGTIKTGSAETLPQISCWRYESRSASQPAGYTHYDGVPVQKIPLSQKPPQTGAAPFQASLKPTGGPYSAAVTQPQQSSFCSSNVCSLGQTFESDSAPVLAITTSDLSYVVPIDTEVASRAAYKKRRRNAEASERFRERNKKKKRESAQLEETIKELKVERDFYRKRLERLSKTHVPNGGPGTPSQLGFYANASSEQTSKSERVSAKDGYFNAGQVPLLTTHTPVPHCFPPTPTLLPPMSTRTLSFSAIPEPFCYDAHIRRP